MLIHQAAGTGALWANTGKNFAPHFLNGREGRVFACQLHMLKDARAKVYMHVDKSGEVYAVARRATGEEWIAAELESVLAPGTLPFVG